MKSIAILLDGGGLSLGKVRLEGNITAQPVVKLDLLGERRELRAFGAVFELEPP